MTVPACALEVTAPDVLEVEPSLLDALGWRAVVALDAVEDGALRELVRGESLGGHHLWSSLELDRERPLADQLAAFEASRHVSSKLLFYVGVPHRGHAVLFATAAVGGRVSRAFPFDGLPVLNRVVIAPALRGHGLYPYLLRHRFEYCRDRWGARLVGVHIATACERVRHTLGHPIGGSRFLYLGSHFMPTPQRTVTSAFVWLPRTRREALAAAFPEREPMWRALGEHVAKLASNRFVDGDLGVLLELADRVERATGVAPLERPGVRELVALMSAVPVNHHAAAE